MNDKRAPAPETLKAGGRGKILALVPILVGVVFAALLLPRSAPPDHVPLPIVNLDAIEAIEAADHVLAEEARAGLPDDVRALGSAIRDYLTADSFGRDLGELKRKLNQALIVVNPRENPEAVLQLRAVQLESFLEEAQKLEETGEETDEFRALTGSLEILRRERRLEGTHWRMTRHELRAAFKERWCVPLNLQQDAPFKLALDEERLLYRFKLVYPHLHAHERNRIEAQRRAAPDAHHCRSVEIGEEIALENQRRDDILKLAALDSDYPRDYAVGVVEYRAGHYGASADAFRAWLEHHPNGAFTLRAENHLRAAIAAQSPSR